MAQRKQNEQKPSRFGLGRKEWKFVEGKLALRLWFFAPQGSDSFTGSAYGQPFPPTTLAATGLTAVEILGVDVKMPPRVEASCVSPSGEALTFSQDIPAEQPINTEQVEVKWRDYKDGNALGLEVAARVLNAAGRVIPPVTVTFTLSNGTSASIATDANGVAPTTFPGLEYNRTYTLTVTTPSSGTRSVPITIKPARNVKYDIIELPLEEPTGAPTMFILRIAVWDDQKGVPLRGLRVNGHVGHDYDSGVTNEQGIAELLFEFDPKSDKTYYRVLVEDGKDTRSHITRPAPTGTGVETTASPTNFREAFRNARTR